MYWNDNMSNVFVTSDLHFFHKKIIEYCPDSRPFSSLEEMHDTIISNWNDRVNQNDKVYILGDVSFGNSAKTVDILNSLNGEKHLITGNHDASYLRVPSFVECFASVQNYLEIKHNKQFICMFHYPIEKWNRCHYGSIHLHGHLHLPSNSYKQRRMDVGLDSHNMHPYNLNDIVDIMLTIPVPERTHHNKENYV